MSVAALIVAHAEAVSAGAYIEPDDLDRRCIALRGRGVTKSIVDDIWRLGCGAGPMLRQVEALSTEDVRQLNALASAPK